MSKERPPPAFSRSLRQQIQALEQCWAELGKSLAARAADAPVGLDLTQAQFHALRYICEHRRLTAQDLATGLSVPEPTAARLVDRLLRAGLVDRRLDPSERRTVWLESTNHGRRLLSTARGHRYQEVRALMERLDPEERELFVALFEKLTSRR
jgi:DNA-binding MarR family transcriptional regulator